MICSICKNQLHISDGITEKNNKKFHVECLKRFEIDWRKKKGMNNN